MNDPIAPGPDASTPADPRQARNALRAAVEALLAGSGLEIRDLPHDLLISNPRDPEKGHVYIGCPDGHVAWKRAAWDHWGSLTDSDSDPDSEPGNPGSGNSAEDIAGKIISALTGTTLGRMQ